MEQKQIIRIISSDIPGQIQLEQALTRIPGVGHSFASAVCNNVHLDKKRKVGTLSKEEVNKIEDVIKNPIKNSIPAYLLNRRNDIDTGEDKHLITANLKLTKEFDVKRLKLIKSYRGIRHAQGLPVRGQKTRSNFRKGKAIGVSKKKKQGKKG